MESMFTQDYLSLENEASRLLDLFEKLPDDYFANRKSTVEQVVRKLKAYARVYNSFSFNGNDAEFIIN